MPKPLIKKNKQKEIARERIKILFEQADEAFSKNKSLADRYVILARKLAMKVKIKLPVEMKRKFCKHCHKYLRAGVNSRVRTRQGKVVISCLECRKFMRIPIR